MLFSVYHIGGCVTSVHVITGDVNFDDLVKVVFVRFLYYKVLIFLYIGGYTIQIPWSPQTFAHLFLPCICGSAGSSYYCGVLMVIFFLPHWDFS